MFTNYQLNMQKAIKTDMENTENAPVIIANCISNK